MHIFGSDGFRSKYGEGFLTNEYILRFAEAVSKVIKKLDNKSILIARDTRNSGKMIEKKIIKIFIKNGINIFKAGIVPSPCVSSLLKSNKFSLGIMITASHNPASDNGIKLFSKNGYKLDKTIENIIENEMLLNKESYIKSEIKGVEYSIKKPFTNYISKVKQAYFYDKYIDYKILIDCANGAFSKLITQIFKKNRNIKVINNKPNGSNINYKSGAVYPDILYKKLLKYKYDYGVAFDGDGDRVIFVSKEYKGLIETEKILILFTRILKPKKNKIVSSEICNLSLKYESKKTGYSLIEVPVGDRYIIDKVKKTNAIIGAEPSGHYFIAKTSFTMDGLSAMMLFLRLLKLFKDDLNNELHKINFFKRIVKNIKIRKISKNKINQIKKIMKKKVNLKNEKIIIRLSMWDPVLRIYYDYHKKNNFKKYYNQILKLSSL